MITENIDNNFQISIEGDHLKVSNFSNEELLNYINDPDLPKTYERKGRKKSKYKNCEQNIAGEDNNACGKKDENIEMEEDFENMDISDTILSEIALNDKLKTISREKKKKIKGRNYINIVILGHNEVGKSSFCIRYVENKYEVSNELYPLLCKTPGDADLLHNYEPESFYEYVELVVDNVAEVEPANAFKSAGKLALKSDEGYDLKLFWRAFVQVCLERIEKGPESVIHYCNGIIATTKCLNKVSKLGVNKQQLYDKWVFDIREVWVNE